MIYEVHRVFPVKINKRSTDNLYYLEMGYEHRYRELPKKGYIENEVRITMSHQYYDAQAGEEFLPTYELVFIITDNEKMFFNSENKVTRHPKLNQVIADLLSLTFDLTSEELKTKEGYKSFAEYPPLKDPNEEWLKRADILLSIDQN